MNMGEGGMVFFEKLVNKNVINPKQVDSFFEKLDNWPEMKGTITMLFIKTLSGFHCNCKPTWKTRAEVYLLVLSSTTGISGGFGQSRQKQNGRKTKKTKTRFILKDIIKICTLKVM